MSKLLDLTITDEEYKASQPPKPSASAWQQFLPDSKGGDGMLSGCVDSPDTCDGPRDPSPVLPTELAESLDKREGEHCEPVPREVGTTRHELRALLVVSFLLVRCASVSA